MIQLVILGSGNVATHLFTAFSASKTVQVKQVYNHSRESLSFFEKKVAITTDLASLSEADVYLLALKDDRIADIAKSIRRPQSLVVHTSGSVPLEALQGCPRRGVFYPLQTFSRSRELRYRNIPLCLESDSATGKELLMTLGQEISDSIFEVSSEQRKKLHLAAVFVCNFVNHLYSIGEDICTRNALPFEILQPLITETASKVLELSPADAQTGPALRADTSTIKTHLDLLENQDQREIYQVLTNAIQTFHGKKL